MEESESGIEGSEPDIEESEPGMEESEPTYGRGAYILAVVVFAVAVITAVGNTLVRGAAGALEGILFVFLAGVLLYGVFRNRLEAPPVQAAFGVGLTAYGSFLYLTGGSLLWLALAGVGGALVANNLAELRS